MIRRMWLKRKIRKIEMSHGTHDSAKTLPKVEGKRLVWVEGHNGMGKSFITNISAISVRNHRFL